MTNVKNSVCISYKKVYFSLSGSRVPGIVQIFPVVREIAISNHNKIKIQDNILDNITLLVVNKR